MIHLIIYPIIARQSYVSIQCFFHNDDGDVDEDDEDEHLIVVRVLLYHVVSQLLRTQTVWKDCRFPHPCNLFKLGFHPQEEACLKHTPRVERNIL